jgi:hypothetical protein
VERIRDVIKSGLHIGLDTLPAEDRLAMAWIAVGGPRLAARAEVVAYDQATGTVTVAVGERPWLEELRSMSFQLEPQLAQSAGVKVSKLHWIVKQY